jgi:hypothetical protein
MPNLLNKDKLDLKLKNINKKFEFKFKLNKRRKLSKKFLIDRLTNSRNLLIKGIFINLFSFLNKKRNKFHIKWSEFAKMNLRTFINFKKFTTKVKLTSNLRKKKIYNILEKFLFFKKESYI